MERAMSRDKIEVNDRQVWPSKQDLSKQKLSMRKNIFACLFSVHNTICLSCHEQVCLMSVHFEGYFSHGRGISRNVASLNTCSWRDKLIALQ